MNELGGNGGGGLMCLTVFCGLGLGYTITFYIRFENGVWSYLNIPIILIPSYLFIGGDADYEERKNRK